MGYRKNKKVYNLKFADPEMAGLEVSMKSLSVAAFLKISSLAGTSEDGTENVKNLLTEFSRNIIRWNLEDDEGVPVPATYEGVAAQEFPFVMEIISAWTNAATGVDSPLKQDSGNGKAERELDLASLSRPN